MTNGQRIGLLLNKRKMLAQRAIEAGLVDSLDHNATYRTFMEAYDNEEIAQRAAAIAAERYVNWKIAQHDASK